MAKKAESSGEQPVVGRPVRTEEIDYKKLAGMSSDGEKMDRKSMKSGWSNKSNKPTKKKNAEAKLVQSGDGEDSRAGDFDSEEDSSVDSTRKLCSLQDQIDMLELSLALRYNEYKVAQGTQDRLEDCDLPQDLNDPKVFEQWKELHEEQLKSTKEREQKAVNRLHLI